LRHFCKANDKPLVDLTPDATDALLTYDWPGNVRELRTAIAHGVVMATGPKDLRDLPMAVRQAAGARSCPAEFQLRLSAKEQVPSICTRRKKLIAQALAVRMAT
jgi:DNA-binding NtrC family response regulator